MPLTFNHEDVKFVWNSASDYVEVYDVLETVTPFTTFRLWDYLHPVDTSQNYFQDACKEWAKDVIRKDVIS